MTVYLLEEDGAVPGTPSKILGIFATKKGAKAKVQSLYPEVDITWETEDPGYFWLAEVDDYTRLTGGTYIISKQEVQP